MYLNAEIIILEIFRSFIITTIDIIFYELLVFFIIIIIIIIIVIIITIYDKLILNFEAKFFLLIKCRCEISKWSVQLPKIRQSFYSYLNSNIFSHLNRVKIFLNFNRHQLIKHCTEKKFKKNVQKALCSAKYWDPFKTYRIFF